MQRKTKFLRLGDPVDYAIQYINSQIKYYRASPCSFHRYKHCFLVTSNVDNQTFHALLDKQSDTFIPFYEGAGTNCTVPLFCHRLKQMNEQMGDDFVLPLSTYIRDPNGQTSVLFRMRPMLYPPTVIDECALPHVFLGYLVYLCHVALFCTKVPVLRDMKFMYTRMYPVLVDVGKANASVIEMEEKKKRKQVLLLRKTKVNQVLAYMTGVFPRFLTKRKKDNCRLNPNLQFSDLAHQVFCKMNDRSIYEILTSVKDEKGPFQSFILNLLQSMDECI